MSSIQDEIRKDVTENPVILYMKGNADFPLCGFSARVVEILKMYGVPFVTRDVMQNVALRQGIKEFTNWPTIPQLYIRGEFIGGCDIVSEMHNKGELKPLLAGLESTAAPSTSTH